MKNNIGTTDKIIRITLAIIIAILWYINIISGVFAIVLFIIAFILVATSLIGFCGLYTLFGYSTCPIKK